MTEEGGERGEDRIKCATLDLDEGELFSVMTETDMMEKEETTGDILSQLSQPLWAPETPLHA